MGKLLVLKIGSNGPEPQYQDGDIITTILDNHRLDDAMYERFYIIRVNEFTEAMSGILSESVWDNTDLDRPVLLKKRLRNIDWRNDLGLTEDEIKEIDNRKIKVDHTATKSFLRANIVKVKT